MTCAAARVAQRARRAWALVTIQAAETLPDVLFRRAGQTPDAVALRRRTPQGWQDVTAAQLCTEVVALAKGLVAAGLQPGDRVGLMSRTRYEWTVIDYALWTAGAVTVPVYETSSAEQVQWILGDSEACGVFAETGSHEAIITSVRSHLPGLRQIWRIEELDKLASAGTEVSDERLAELRACAAAADLATIVYTSGTTGRPKGCQITHANLLADVRNAVGTLPEIFQAPGSSTLLFLPLAHVFARIIQVGVLESGAVLGHWPNVESLDSGLAEFRPTFLLAVPRVFEKVYDSAQQAAAGPVGRRVFEAAAATAIAWSRAGDGTADDGTADDGTVGTAQDDSAGHGRPGLALRLRRALFDLLVYRRIRAAIGGQVRYAISGGAPLSDRLGHFFGGAGLTVLEGYGLTETTGAVTVNRPARNRVGTVGEPTPGTTVRIAADSEILIKGASVFGGYWRDDAATRGVLGQDGWLHTGDLGALDDAGFLRVTGRRKELIVTAGGTNVVPAVLEDRLRAHYLVSQCMVVGEGRPYIACLVTVDPQGLEFWKRQHRRPAAATVGELAADPELTAEIQRAVDEANKAVSRAESIRRFVVLATDFTEESGQLTPSLKVRRAVVARDFAADIDALYRPATARGT